MAALKLMVDLRAQRGRPAPESTSVEDRAEFQAIARTLLARTREAFVVDLPSDLREALTRAEAAGSDEPARLLAGQVFLARHLPDYWQRFERYQGERAAQELAEAAKPGWLRRLLHPS